MAAASPNAASQPPGISATVRAVMFNSPRASSVVVFKTSFVGILFVIPLGRKVARIMLRLTPRSISNEGEG